MAFFRLSTCGSGSSMTTIVLGRFLAGFPGPVRLGDMVSPDFKATLVLVAMTPCGGGQPGTHEALFTFTAPL